MMRLGKALDIAAIIVILAVPSFSSAAEITQGKSKSSVNIHIDGEIAEGDYEKLINQILESGVSRNTIYLTSKGGNALEAIKIGRLIKSLGYQTEVPTRAGGKPVCLEEAKDCTCESSCALIYLSGSYRSGDVVGVHRIYLDKDAASKIKNEDAISLNLRIFDALTTYLDFVEAPQSLRELILSTPPDKVRFLQKDYIHEVIGKSPPSVNDWLISKCGSTNAIWDEMQRSSGKPLKELGKKFEEVLACKSDSLFVLSSGRFYSAMSDAIKSSRDEFLKERTLISETKKYDGMGMDYAIGMSVEDGVKLLSRFGLPGNKSYVLGESYFVNRTHLIGTLEDGKIWEVGFYVEKSLDPKMLPYNGFFLNGISAIPKKSDFDETFNEKIERGCHKEVCRTDYLSSRTDFHVMWFKGTGSIYHVRMQKKASFIE